MTLSSSDWKKVLAVPMFGAIDAPTVEWLLEGLSLFELPDGGALFAKGDAADRFFIVLDGQVHLFALTESGDQSIIEVVGAGQSFAEGAIFASGRFPLNGEAMAGSRLLAIPAPSFLNKLSARKDVAFKLLASLASWQQRLIREIAEIKGKSPAQRLASFLLASVGDAAVPRLGAAEVVLSLTKAELASRIGITPESLSRAIHRLGPLGVSSHRRNFSIRDLDELRRYCGEVA